MITPDALCPSCFAAVESIELGDDGLCVACHYGITIDAVAPITNLRKVRGGESAQE